MNSFSIKWDTETKPLARKCVNSEFIELMFKGERKTITPEEETRFQEIGATLKDPYGMYYISDMIWRVEHGLADGRDYQSKLAVSQIYTTLARESYIQNVWDNDTTSEECQNILKLRDSLDELLRL